MEKEDLENIDLQEDTAKVKNKRKVLRKVKRKKSKRLQSSDKQFAWPIVSKFVKSVATIKK